MLHDEKTDQSAEYSNSKDGSDHQIDYEAGQPATPLNTKAMIIDKELNRHGMGRYQWCIWAICGTGLLLDVMWYAIFSYAAPSMQRELGYSDKEYGNLFSSFSAGLMAGAAVWGILVDILGRRLAFLGTVLVAGVFGICLGALSSYSSILVFVAFTGFGVGGNLPIDSTITVEYLPEDHFYLLSALSLFQPLANVACSLISYGFIPNFSCDTNLEACHLVSPGAPCCTKESNMGWRYMFFTLGAITFGIFILRFFIFPFYESPKFLLTKGNDQMAVDIVRKIAAFNKRPCDLTLESLRKMAIDGPSPTQAAEQTWRQRIYKEIVRHKLLFANWRVARITILIWITWMFDYLGFGIANSFLPTILQRKNIVIHETLQETYRDYFIVYCPGILAVILAVFLVRVPALGRKWTLVLSSMMMGVSLFLYSVVTTEASHVGFNAMEYFFQSLFNAVLFGWTPEAFPAEVRGSAAGLASFFGGLFGVAGPLIAAQLFARTNGSNSVLYLAGSGVFVCTICLICIPSKYMVVSRW